MVTAAHSPYFYSIPDNIQIDELVERQPPGFPYFKRSKALWILEEITKRDKRDGTLVQLPSSYLKPFVWNYQEYLRYFRRCGLITGDNHYIVPGRGPQSEAKSYGFTESVSHVVAKQHGEPVGTRSQHKKTRSCSFSGYVNNPRFLDTSALTSTDLSTHHQSWGHLITGRWYCRESIRYGRIFTPVTNMPSDLRPFLKIDGDDQLSEVDVKTCYPFLLTIEATDNDVSEGAIADWVQLVTEGDIYDVLGKRLRRSADCDTISRSKLKKTFYQYVNGTNNAHSQIKKEFTALCPEFAAMLNNLKAKDHRVVAHNLMRHEAEIMFQHVQPRLEESEIPCFTIHDCLLTRTVDADRAALILEEEFSRAVGHQVRTETVPLQKPPLKKKSLATCSGVT